MILILNCGSQSVKWKLFSEELKKIKEGTTKATDEKAYGDFLLNELEGLAEYKSEIKIIGHRVVHNGGKFKGLLALNNEKLMELEGFNKLAPLHNPFSILGVKTAQRVFPLAKQIAGFDTDFFADLPEVSKTYAIPREISEKYGFRRFGFHGLSHEFVAQKAAKKLGEPFDKLRIITCHLGGGASITAIKNGRAVDTSMGYSPMEGLVMDTRAGNLDSEIVLELAEEFSVEKAREILNKESGLMGLCRTGEMLEVFNKIKRGDSNAKLAFDVFVYSIKKYIGAYFAILGGCDALVFTGSIGSGLPKTRKAILKDLNILKNTKVFVIKTDEELAIAQKIKKS
ncbi:MAG: acetate/propionate family kinase [Candidatus Staskawiczbacteria bacterium]|nr:acetate/propionate family kinase [Candidatus Staskawiczbacteria bacterium]